MADFRQFYGIDLPLEAGDEDCTRWAMLWHALPRESRTARRQSPALEWSEGEYMLNQAVYYLKLLAWRQCTKDGRKGRRAPSRRRPRARGQTPSDAAPTRSARAAR